MLPRTTLPRVGILLAIAALTAMPPAQAAHNDSLASAIEICCWPTSSGAPFYSYTVPATLESGEPQPCGGIGRTVWYKLSFSFDEVWPVVVSTFGSNYDTVLAAYRIPKGWPVTFGNLQLVSCVDDTGVYTSSTSRSPIAFVASNDYDYYFQAGGYGGAGGDLWFNYETNVACVCT